MRHLDKLLSGLAHLAVPEQLSGFFQRRETNTHLHALPRVGGLASIPTRVETLGTVLDHIVPQVDRLHLFLHGYRDVPETANRPGVIPYLAPLDHPYRASGKFYGLAQETEPCLYFCFDDDILYSPGYVEHTRRGLLDYGSYAAVGYHSIVFNRPRRGYMAQRRLSFRRETWIDRRVDAIGTGTLAFASTLLPLDPSRWRYGDMDDLMFAQQAAQRGIPLVSLARNKGLMVAIAQGQTDSLDWNARRDSSRHDEEMRRLITIKRKAAPRAS